MHPARALEIAARRVVEFRLAGDAARVARFNLQGATLHLLYVVAMASAFGEPAISATLHSRAEEKAIEALKAIAANTRGPRQSALCICTLVHD
jgi:hypothetical protein